jgi:hypothetical protein
MCSVEPAVYLAIQLRSRREAGRGSATSHRLLVHWTILRHWPRNPLYRGPSRAPSSVALGLEQSKVDAAFTALGNTQTTYLDSLGF